MKNHRKKLHRAIKQKSIPNHFPPKLKKWIEGKIADENSLLIDEMHKHLDLQLKRAMDKEE